jgi:hypothetical protein
MFFLVIKIKPSTFDSLKREKKEKITPKTQITMSKFKQKSKKNINRLGIMQEKRHLNEFLGCL